jgi:Wiskott-Aldrich syndrome protein
MQPPPLKIERPSSPLPQPSTPTYASDYFTSVPYDQSSLSSMPEWHLPTSRPPRVAHAHLPRLTTPQPQPTLISAYHHILTRPPPPTVYVINPSRHKVALALLSLTQSSPRWEPPNTLYSSSAPCSPRVAVIGPTFPTLIGETAHGPGDQGAADAERERKANLPPLPPRPVFVNERITSLVTQQPSRIPELARHVLPVRSVQLLHRFRTHNPLSGICS